MGIDIQKELTDCNNWILEQDDDFVTGYGQGNYALGLARLAWQAAKAQAVPECKWSKNQGGFYDTSCINAFVFPESDDTPEYHEFTHCPFCGGKLSEAQEPTDD